MKKTSLKKFSITKWKNFSRKDNLVFVLVILSLLPCCILAQDTNKLTGVKGVSYISDDITAKQARQLALDDAKITALKAVGIEEHINTYQLLFSSQVNNDYSQFFSSDTQSELQGAVQSYEIKSERRYQKSENEWIYEVIIDAVVIKFNNKPDAAFDTNVEGIKKVYNNDEELSFSVKATKDCYLTVFNITDENATLLYPNAYERQTQCIAFEVYKFPVAKIDYVLHTDKNEVETNRLIFVFTKTQIPFVKMDKEQTTTHENIFTWIYSITPDQRKVDYIALTILK
jgi:hypothetical protein